MTTPAPKSLEELLAARTAAAAEYETQAGVLAGLRAAGAACDAAAIDDSKASLKVARQALDAAKKDVEAAEGVAGMGDFNRAETETLLKRRFFYTPAFEIYGGVAGLYDYGPPGMLFRCVLLCFLLWIGWCV